MFGFFHLCNHEVKLTQKSYDKKKFVVRTTSPKEITRVVKGMIIKEIHGVIVHEQVDFIPKEKMDYDEREDYDIQTLTKGYYDEDPYELIDYSPWIETGEYIPREYYDRYLNNRIKWNVRPPLVYTVVADVIIKGEFKHTEDPYDCDICQGNGWYVDITDSEQRFIKSRGAYKVLQNVIKDLLTKRRSSRLDREYGQNLHLFPQNHYSEESFLEAIQLEVNEVEDKYLLKQQSKIERIPHDEVLVDLQVMKAYVPKNEKTKVVIFLRVITEMEDKMFQLKI